MLFAADVFELHTHDDDVIPFTPFADFLRIPFVHLGRVLVALDSREPTAAERKRVAAEAWIKVEGYNRMAIVRQHGLERVAEMIKEHVHETMTEAPIQLAIGGLMQFHQYLSSDDDSLYSGADFYYDNIAQSWVIAVSEVRSGHKDRDKTA
jgi:hypothetical protein